MRRSLLAALAAGALALAGAGPAWSTDPPVPGGAGIDTSLRATESQVTVAGRDRFADLRITVNQTKDLANQAISVTWTGAIPTTTGNGARFNEHYLQIFQCWGDDDGAFPGNPGPPPEQCQQGASDAVYGGRSSGLFPGGGLALERIISRRDRPNFDPAQGDLDERTGYVWKRFQPVDGPPTTVHYDPTFNPAVVGGNYWLNPYFNVITTNEIPGGRTAPNGTGAELFEATTGLESSGLGCGQRTQAQPDGSKKVPRCWIVVVPRGSAADENVGSGAEADRGVFTSPLSPLAWQNRISIELGFNPVETSCPISAEQRRLVGSELLAAAVASWQPALCASPGLPPYAFGSISDARAREQLLSGVPGTPGLAVTSRPLDPATVDPANPVVYAPLSLSGTVIGFNIERNPRPTAPPEETPLQGVRVARINLTPRLVAKLLTQSYRSQVEISGSVPPYDWSPGNPPHIALDPDFLQFNPEFNLLQTASGKNLGGMLLASPGSDAALQVWEWVLADSEAKAWLDGQPDAWGMKVNPVFATSAGANASGTAFADPAPDTYPKSDPYCYQAPPQGASASVVPPPLCGLDWLPYTQSLRDAARLTRAANDGARTSNDPNAPSPDKVYKPDGPQILGSRAILSLTDSASAAQYGLQTARLSRSGDNGPDRTFIAPDAPGLDSGVQAMAPKAVPEVLEPDPASSTPGAYPLTALTYAAVAPLSLDAQARKEYAAFIDYAVGSGQSPGRKLGQLPPGYQPLPPHLRAQGEAAASRIRDLQASAPPDAPPSGDPSSGTGEPGGPGTGDPFGALQPDQGGGPPEGGTTGGGRGGSVPAPGAAKAPSPLAALAKALMTPIEALARSRFLLPGLAVVAVLSALGALEITRRPRRSEAMAGASPAVQPEDTGMSATPAIVPPDAPSSHEEEPHESPMVEVLKT